MIRRALAVALLLTLAYSPASGQTIVSVNTKPLPTGCATGQVPSYSTVTGAWSCATPIVTGDSPTFASIVLTRGTIATSQPNISATATWNAAGVSFKGLTYAFTETASAAGSRYLEILGGASGTTDEFYVAKGGSGFFATGVVIGNNSWVSNSNQMTQVNGGSNFVTLDNGSVLFTVRSDMKLGWANTTNSTSSLDTYWVRAAAGVASLLGASAADTAVVKAKTHQANAGAFSTCNASPVEGMLCAITDSSTATWGATITGSGANHVLGYYNGTNWTVAGK